MDAVRKLILDRLKELNLTMGEASRLIGKNAAYMQQFLKRGIPLELHERDRIKLAEVLKVPEDTLRGPSVTLPSRNYEKNVVTSRKSLIDPGLPAPYPSEPSNQQRIVPGADLFGERLDLPVFGTAQGGVDGAMLVTDRAVDWVARPPMLLRVQDGYGMIVSGDSMEPAHKSGSIALVNPHLPPRVGDSCVFRSHGEDGTNTALIKEYRGQTELLWKVRQYNPAKDFSLKKSEWQIVHRTVGSYFA